MEKFKDLIHACVPRNGASRSWSPLHFRKFAVKVVGENFDPKRLQNVALVFLFLPIHKSTVTSCGEVKMILYAARDLKCVGEPSVTLYPLIDCSLLPKSFL
jgi:hypothetical protein